MGIQVGDNFDHKSKKPLDNRTAYATLAAMKAVVDATINEGCLAYCAETDKYYKFLSTNTVDESTGKWREFQTGGGAQIDDSTTAANKTWSSNKVSTELEKKSDFSGSYEDLTNKPTIPANIDDLTDVEISSAANGQVLTFESSTNKWKNKQVAGGHTIKNPSGTSMTQRTNLQFAEPFSASDDSSGDKTVISQKELSASDLDDFDEPSQASTGVTNISQMADVAISSATSGQALVFNGTKWANSYRDYHEYSTTEKVVGKWIDGKTIYEKTLSFTAPSSGNTSFLSVGASVDYYVDIVGRIQLSTSKTIGILPYVSGTDGETYSRAWEIVGLPNNATDTTNKNKLRIENTIGGFANQSGYITVRYTKV